MPNGRCARTSTAPGRMKISVNAARWNFAMKFHEEFFRNDACMTAPIYHIGSPCASATAW